MLKKILLGATLTALSGALIVGAVNRTADKTTVAAQGDGQGRGNGAEVAEGRGQGQGQGQGQRQGQGQGQGQGQRQGQGQGQGQGQAQSQGQQGQGQNGNGNRRGQSDGATGSGDGVAQVTEWLTVEGTVLTVDASAMTLTTASDGEIVVDGRQWSYAVEQGFATQAGDSVRLTGFYEDGEFKVGQVENLSTGLGVVLRGESGRPGWAGNGNRQGQQGQRGS